MKRAISIVMAMLMAACLLAGCGGGNTEDQSRPADSKAESSVKETSSAEISGNETSVQEPSAPAEASAADSAPESAEESVPEEPQGPVELDLVLYEDNGIRITAVRSESFFDGYEKLRQDESVCSLELKLEALEEGHSTVRLQEMVLNGWMAGSGEYALPGHEGFGKDIELLNENAEDTLIVSFTKKFAEKYGIKAAGAIRILIKVKHPDEKNDYAVLSVVLDEAAETFSCDASFEAVHDPGVYLFKVGSSFDQLVKPVFLLRAEDAEGNACYEKESISKDRGQLTNGIPYQMAAAPQAKDQYYAVNEMNGFTWYDGEGNNIYHGVDTVEAEWVGCTLYGMDDLSSHVTFMVEGVDEKDPRRMNVRFGCPDYPTVLLQGTLVTFDEKGNVLQYGDAGVMLDSSRDYREDPTYSIIYLLNPDTGAVEGTHVYMSDFDPVTEYASCEFYVNYVVSLG